MTVFLITLSALLLAGAIWCLYGRQTLAPALSYLSLLSLSFISEGGYQTLPINNTILTGWLCMTLVVIFIVILQPDQVRLQTRGMTYFIAGGIAGLAVGLLGFSFCQSISLRYTCMALGVLAGVALGFLLYTNTPDGRAIRPGSGYFFRYLLAKGFPTAITLMMPGVALVLLVAIKNVNGL